MSENSVMIFAINVHENTMYWRLGSLAVSTPNDGRLLNLEIYNLNNGITHWWTNNLTALLESDENYEIGAVEGSKAHTLEEHII